MHTFNNLSLLQKKRRKQKSAYPGTPMQGVGKNQGLKITKIKFVRQKKINI